MKTPKRPCQNHENGVWAESIAAKHFQRKGYQVKASRFRSKLGEIDLVILKKGGSLFFVEVKLVGASSFWKTRYAEAQKQRMIRMIEFFQEAWDQDIGFLLVFVTHRGQVYVFDDVLQNVCG